MLRWGRLGHFKKYILHPVPENERVGVFTKIILTTKAQQGWDIFKNLSGNAQKGWGEIHWSTSYFGVA